MNKEGWFGALVGAFLLLSSSMAVAKVGVVSDTFTRLADTDNYSDNDLIANHTTAASVVPLKFVLKGHGAKIVGIRITKSTTGLTADDFTINFYGAVPVPTVGDNAALVTTTVPSGANKLATVITGVMVASSDGAYQHLIAGVAGTDVFDPIPVAGKTVWALLEANSTYNPGSAEVFTVYLYYEYD